MSGVFDTAYSLLRFTESGMPRGSLAARYLCALMLLLYAYLHTAVPNEGLPVVISRERNDNEEM